MNEWIGVTGYDSGQDIDIRAESVNAFEPLMIRGKVVGTTLCLPYLQIKVTEKPEEIRVLLGIKR